MFDEVLCNHELFGKHRGETHQTTGLNPTFPGDMYEITASGRLELLECEYEEHEDTNAQDVKEFAKSWKPVFTGIRRDLNYHGWLRLSCFGRVKFTDGKMVAFEPEPASE